MGDISGDFRETCGFWGDDVIVFQLMLCYIFLSENALPQSLGARCTRAKFSVKHLAIRREQNTLYSFIRLRLQVSLDGAASWSRACMAVCTKGAICARNIALFDGHHD